MDLVRDTDEYLPIHKTASLFLISLRFWVTWWESCFPERLKWCFWRSWENKKGMWTNVFKIVSHSLLYYSFLYIWERQERRKFLFFFLLILMNSWYLIDFPQGGLRNVSWFQFLPSEAELNPTSDTRFKLWAFFVFLWTFIWWQCVLI